MEEVRLYCPNCGRKMTGKKSENGDVRMKCSCCRAVVFSRKRTPKSLNIKLTMGKDEIE